MGITDFFKKKEPEPDFNTNLGLDFGSDPNKNFGKDPNGDFNNPNQYMPHQEAAVAPSVNLSTAQFHQNPDNDLQKDLQILSLKLDAIKAELDGMNQRIKNIEQIAQKEQQQTQTKRWY
ncbi:MAG: hypothetical protein ACP5NV_03060 [Candidatus Woesearchaeota archaeon]